MSKFLVYALVDPRDGAIRYIGKSTSGIYRARSHRTPSGLARDRNVGKRRWLMDLRVLGLSYDIHILETTERETLSAAEIRHIAEQRAAGAALFNITDGGDGATPGVPLSIEHRKKIGDAQRGKRRPPQSVINSANTKRGSRHTEETKRKMSIAHTGIKPSASVRQKISANRRGLAVAASTRVKLSSAWDRLTPEQRIARGRAISAGRLAARTGLNQRRTT